LGSKYHLFKRAQSWPPLLQVYVRNPTDLSTIKARLEGVNPSSQGGAAANAATAAAAAAAAGGAYRSFGQLFGDLRRMFTNAIVYNTKHLATDTTGISQLVLDAAHTLQVRNIDTRKQALVQALIRPCRAM
jgi:hypothetical protein